MFCGWLPIYVICLQTFITLTFVTISFWYISFISASLLLFAYCLQLYLVTPTWELWRRICSSCWSLFLNGLPLYSFVISLQTYIYILQYRYHEVLRGLSVWAGTEEKKTELNKSQRQRMNECIITTTFWKNIYKDIYIYNYTRLNCKNTTTTKKNIK